MLLLNEKVETPGLKSAAESIFVAARTAPKGKAAIELGLLGDDVLIAYAIPLFAKGKNHFFDRS
jgi:uncharacterized ferredoxin-like protein